MLLALPANCAANIIFQAHSRNRQACLLLHRLTERLKLNVYLLRSRKSRNDSTSSKGSDGKVSRLSAMDVAIFEANAEPKPRPFTAMTRGRVRTLLCYQIVRTCRLTTINQGKMCDMSSKVLKYFIFD